jgi:glycosyltransferase involved in cell wall biosynthesis
MSLPRRILFTDFTLPYLLADDSVAIGGWAVQLEKWLRGISAIGLSGGVLTWKGANAHVGHALSFDLLETYDPDRGIRIAKYFYLYIPLLLKAARTFEPDVIIQSTHSIHTGIMAWIASRLNVPFVHWIASDIDADGRYKSEMALYERLAYSYGLDRARMIICQNEYQLAELRKIYPHKQLAIVENVFEMPAGTLSPLQRRERRYVAWLGVFRKPKNMPLLLRVARALPEIEFRVAGIPAQEMDADTAQALETLKSLSNVRFAGYMSRKDVLAFLAEASALLCTSHYEGFPNTFLEAFAVGTPVVTRKIVDPNTIVSRNDLGYVASDESGLIEAIRALAGLRDEEYSDLALRCRRYVEDSHAPKAAAGRLVSLIGTIDAAGSRRG